MGSTVNLADLGRRVRAARLARGLTLEQVVADVDLTVSWLSKIENGLLQPSLIALVKLAEALGCGVDHLVAGLSAPPRHAVIRGSANGDGAAAKVLLGRWTHSAMLPELLHLVAAHRSHGPDQHDGERFLFVLDGRVQVDYGAERIDLEAGDGMYLEATTPHTLRATGAAARVLSVSCAGAAAGAPRGHRNVSRRAVPRASAAGAAKTRGRASGRT